MRRITNMMGVSAVFVVENGNGSGIGIGRLACIVITAKVILHGALVLVVASAWHVKPILVIIGMTHIHKIHLSSVFVKGPIGEKIILSYYQTGGGDVPHTNALVC